MIATLVEMLLADPVPCPVANVPACFGAGPGDPGVTCLPGDIFVLTIDPANGQRQTMTVMCKRPKP